MKKVEAIISPIQLRGVQDALIHEGIDSLTISDVKGCGGDGHVEKYRGAAYVVDFLPKIKIEVVLEDRLAARVAQIIETSVGARRPDDQHVRLLPVEDVIRIRTGQHGAAAV
jgi:nitrogen regulatory protein P-II 1